MLSPELCDGKLHICIEDKKACRVTQNDSKIQWDSEWAEGDVSCHGCLGAFKNDVKCREKQTEYKNFEKNSLFGVELILHSSSERLGMECISESYIGKNGGDSNE